MFVEVVVGIAVKGTGHVLLGGLRPRAAPSEAAATLTGLCVWGLPDRHRRRALARSHAVTA
jgi:hypothetical protein